jgi:hypothetical protein
VTLSIRYYNQQVYHAGSDPIALQVTITNNGPQSFSFRLANDRAFSLDFDVRTNSNRPVEPAAALVRRRTSVQQVYFRNVVLDSGQSFSFTEDLRTFAALEESGSYVVQAKLFPDMINAAGTPVLSNRLGLTVRPALLPGQDGVPQPLAEASTAVLVRESLPPDEVVSYLLDARQKGQWERFFLYIDMDSMVTRDATRQRQWQAESEEGRQRMIARYRSDLQSATVDGDFATIPMSYQIERTNYSSEEGTVTVLERFREGNYIQVKRYTYYLRRQDTIWTLVDYTVVNLGTE